MPFLDDRTWVLPYKPLDKYNSRGFETHLKEGPMETSRVLRRGPALALVLAGIMAASVLTNAATQTKVSTEHFTGTSVNVTGAGDALQIDLLRWSSDAEREQFIAAAEKGDKELQSMLEKGQTLGYVWTSESAGYSVRYAYRTKMPDGTERMVIATDRALGSWNPQIWKPVGAVKGNEYPFTVLELRITPKGGEGKASLLAKVIVDKAAKTLALDGYATAPVVLKNVKRGVRDGKPS
jgi:hypothetical protein